MMSSPSQHDRPWLSVVMPVHNGARWLGDSLSSVAAEDCAGIQVIVLDSSDTIACRNIVAAFGDRLEICYEHMPHNTSWQSKTNLAVQRASAPHISMLHQDDAWLPNRTTEMGKAIAAYPSAVLLLNPSYVMDERGRRLGLWRCPLPQDRLLGTSEIAERLLVQNFISIPAPVIQRQAWLHCGGLDDALWYTADWDLYFKLIAYGAAVYRTTPSTAFRVHASSMTVSGSRNVADFRRQMQMVVDRHVGLIPSAKLPQITRRASASIAVNCALAEASSGSAKAAIRALRAVLSLGPAQTADYLKDSRLIERALPRLKARLMGNF